MGRKYGISRKAEYIPDPFNKTGERIKAHRIIALRDIPLHKVKKGDVGGYIVKAGGFTPEISHEGSAWIAGNAIAIGKVILTENALINGSAVIRGGIIGSSSRRGFLARYGELHIQDDVFITDDAIIDCAKTQFMVSPVISGDVEISGKAYINQLLKIRGSFFPTKDSPSPSMIPLKLVITGNVVIQSHSEISALGEISANAILGEDVKINGLVLISDDSLVRNQAIIKGHVKMTGKTSVDPFITIHNQSLHNTHVRSEEGDKQWKEEIAKLGLPNPFEDEDDDLIVNIAETNEAEALFVHVDEPLNSMWTERFTKICDAIDSYRLDIVKMIKYPIMTDLTDPFTADMIFAFNRAERKMLSGDNKKAQKAISKLEDRFLVAESNAMKLVDTHLDDNDKKKLDKAKNLFAIAFNEKSADTEKKSALKQGFKNLEGIVAVSEKSRTHTYQTLGLREIEM